MSSQEITMGMIPEIQDALLKILAEIEFDVRYYRFYESLAKKKQDIIEIDHCNHSRMIEKVFEKTQYFPAEKYYRKQMECGHDKLWIHIHFQASSVEIGFYLVRKNNTIAGGVFPDLAFKAAYLRDDCFNYDPSLPRLPYAGSKMFEEILCFALDQSLMIKKHLSDHQKINRR